MWPGGGVNLRGDIAPEAHPDGYVLNWLQGGI